MKLLSLTDAETNIGPKESSAKGKPRKSSLTISEMTSSAPFSPFTQEMMNEIFKVSPSLPDRLVSRESGWLEFKEGFNWASREDYARVLASFSNASGGCIVFGVGDRPRRLLGLKSDAFERIDPEKVSEYLNGLFSPEIRWEMSLHGFAGKTFGLMYAYESPHKPVMAAKAEGSKIREADILYRYRGRTERIKYAELRAILDEQRRREQAHWLRHLSSVARIGIENAAVMDVKTGVVKGSGGSFVIDEKLLSKIKFIREGRFDEIFGAPALKVVGDVRLVKEGIIQPTRTVTRTVSIRTPEIVYAFLDQEQGPEPVEYIRQICFETSAMLPLYHFMRLGRIGREEALKIVEGVKARSQSKEKLLKRLRGDECLSLPIPALPSRSAAKRREYRGKILARRLGAIPAEDMKYAIQSVRSLAVAQIHKPFLLPLLKGWFDEYYADRSVNHAYELRMAICHVDKQINEGRY